MTIAQVLQINVRLSEGGAAGVARNLADELSTRGIRSPFAYGYGPHGGSSPMATKYESLRVTPRTIAAANRMYHSLRGRETRIMENAAAARLFEAIQGSDVVHLHVIHSYFLETDYLFDVLIKLRKPVVWTLHDHWAMTGRCAQPDLCTRWTEGCFRCPSLDAYPPARIDFAAPRWKQRRDSIARLQDNVPTTIVPCADWLATDAEKSGLKNIQVIKNSVDRPYWEATNPPVVSRPDPQLRDGSKNIFVCRDLRDRAKVNWDLLEKVAAIPGQRLTIVGDNASRHIPGVNYVPAMSSRHDLAKLFAEHDRLIFTSMVDYYPLTIAEAITAGLRVFAVRSRASEEFRNSSLVELFETTSALVQGVESSREHSHQDADVLRDRMFFSPDRMINEYFNLYKRLTRPS